MAKRDFLTQEVKIASKAGLNAELAAKVVQAASKYSVDIVLYYKDKIIDLKSILGLMSLALPEGEQVKLVATGKRSQEALDDISSILGGKNEK